jgi:hypothetical protein
MPSDDEGFMYVMLFHSTDSPAWVEGCSRPIRADFVGKAFQSMGFPASTAAWASWPLEDGPDTEEGLDLVHRWSWAHFLYESRSEWVEKRWVP